MRLYLIGLPGSGKSCLGKLLAKELGYEFIDMDQYIELQAMMFIDEIFEAYGEQHFRVLESNALKDFLQKDNVVIATGGGVIKNKKNKELMDGKCIYLKAPIDVIQKRCDSSHIVRPLLYYKSIMDLYIERKEMYEYFQDITVDNVDRDITIKEIKKALGVI